VATMSQAPAEVASAIFEALGRKDFEAALAYVDDGAVDDFVPIGLYEGKSAIRRFFVELFLAFPNFTITTERVVGDATTAAVQWRAAGDFKGDPFLGLEPTGRHVEVRGVDVMEIAGGMVRHNTIYYDGASFARQIGMLPKARSAADRALVAGFNSATRLRRRARR